MDRFSGTQRNCYICKKPDARYPCEGCDRFFCSAHAAEHRRELSQQLNHITHECSTLKQDIHYQNVNKNLLDEIDRWEKESIAKIRSSAEGARVDLKRLIEVSKDRLKGLLSKLSTEISGSRNPDKFTEANVFQWKMQLGQLKQDLNMLSRNDLIQQDNSASLPLIIVKNYDTPRDNKTDSSIRKSTSVKEKSSTGHALDEFAQNGPSTIQKSEKSIQINGSSSPQSSTYPSLTFGLERCRDQKIQDLFQCLMALSPMDKNGPMSGRCEVQTYQMENFLSQTFGFQNIPGEYIVHGVKSFKLERFPRRMDPKKTIHFPSNTANSFKMTVQEIINWQQSYRVYASKNYRELTESFLGHALKGKSTDGQEAFLMKFVVRISTCPILMEFDAEIISRELNEDWPNRIKLVSVTGIDFAARKHDAYDIFVYVLNWKDIYEIDLKTKLPVIHNGRDFLVKRGGPPVKLDEDRLWKDLKTMARLRLRACDEEDVQIVVETGIGLGVFSGEHIGIDGKVRLLSALAIRTVLEEDGPNYKNIRAIIFALPILGENKRSRQTSNPFNDFAEQFQTPEYKGSIPILIADQDMHRLTVAIARRGFIVSQLNPADSHGVFGEYWQNLGPAVEEKLALTTVGLLVQHHIINPEVLNIDNYHLI